MGDRLIVGGLVFLIFALGARVIVAVYFLPVNYSPAHRKICSSSAPDAERATARTDKWTITIPKTNQTPTGSSSTTTSLRLPLITVFFISFFLN